MVLAIGIGIHHQPKHFALMNWKLYDMIIINGYNETQPKQIYIWAININRI